MRRNLVLALALSAVLALAGAAVATAKFDTYRVGNVILKADGGVSPKALPRNTYAPVTVQVRGEISTADGTHPPAFRELIADFDKNGKINTKGLPACSGGQLEARDTKSAMSVCGKSQGRPGNGSIEIFVPRTETDRR